jgi:hypothetical protein
MARDLGIHPVLHNMEIIRVRIYLIGGIEMAEIGGALISVRPYNHPRYGCVYVLT